MVEGPVCTLNGEKIRSKIPKGQKVIDVRGTLTKYTAVCFIFFYAAKHGTVTFYFLFNLIRLCLQKTESNGNAFRAFCGYQYTGVDTLGKELFMYFGSRALR